MKLRNFWVGAENGALDALRLSLERSWVARKNALGQNSNIRDAMFRVSQVTGLRGRLLGIYYMKAGDPARRTCV